MKIVHLVNTGVYSGAEKVAIQIIEKCRVESNIEFVYAGKRGMIEEILQEKEIPFYEVNAKSLMEIKKMCQELKPDIIHAHDYTAAFFSCMAVGRKISVLSHLHNNSPENKRVSMKSITLMFSSLISRELLFVSKSVKEEYIFRKLIQKKGIVIGNPLELKLCKAANEKEFDLIFVGRLCREKDPVRFIRIVSQLRKQIPCIKVVMLGDGALKKDCMEVIEKLDLNNTIEMKGFVREPEEYYSKAKVLCLTSQWEGFGLVIFEALSNALPVVCTQVGGTVDLVTEECGKLAVSDEEIIAEISKLLLDKLYYQKKSLNAKLQAENLSNMEEYMENMKKMYLDIVGEK